MPKKSLMPRNRAAAAARTVRVGSKRAWSRDQRLADLGYPTYKAYLTSETWAGIRARYYRANPDCVCFLCGSNKTLVVHHRTYERVGNERLDDLVALCPSCHTFVHTMEAAGYVDCLDPEAVMALSDQQRAERNQVAEAVRRATAEAERRPEPIDRVDPRARSNMNLVNRIRKFAKLAEQDGLDPHPVLAKCVADLQAALNENKRPNEFTRARRKAA